MARSKFIFDKKKVEPANNTPVVSTKSIAKVHRALVKKLEMKTLKYAVMTASLEKNIAAVEQEKIRNNKYADRLVSLAQEIQVASDELFKQEVLENNLSAT